MQLLPKWVLTNPLPGVYDLESGTATEMTARVYAAMNNLIEEYNAFADSINNKITEFTGTTEEQYNLFALDLRQEFQDFIDVISIKYTAQDQLINNAVADMEATAERVIAEAVAAGTLKATDEEARQQIAELTPTMTIGTEYRTPEKWQGKAVFTMLVDIGALPASENKYVYPAIPHSANIVSISGIATDGKYSYPFPLVNATGVRGVISTAYDANNQFYVCVRANQDCSGLTAKVEIKYVKD